MHFYPSEIQFIYNEALEVTGCTDTHGEEASRNPATLGPITVLEYWTCKSTQENQFTGREGLFCTVLQRSLSVVS